MIHFLKRVKIKIDNLLRRYRIGRWRSGTDRCRARLARYCEGYGIDIGAGGDPIKPSAITVDLPTPYTSLSNGAPVQLGGDARDLRWFRDGVLDFVYSSHVLEDFEHPGEVVREWLRVLKPGGTLVIYCPDQKRYVEYCRAHRETSNPYHFYPDFSLEFVLARIPSDLEYTIEHRDPEVDLYSWELVIRKQPSAAKPSVDRIVPAPLD